MQNAYLWFVSKSRTGGRSLSLLSRVIGSCVGSEGQKLSPHLKVWPSSLIKLLVRWSLNQPLVKLQQAWTAGGSPMTHWAPLSSSICKAPLRPVFNSIFSLRWSFAAPSLSSRPLGLRTCGHLHRLRNSCRYTSTDIVLPLPVIASVTVAITHYYCSVLVYYCYCWSCLPIRCDCLFAVVFLRPLFSSLISPSPPLTPPVSLVMVDDLPSFMDSQGLLKVSAF